MKAANMKMTKRAVVRLTLQHQAPPYVPWSFSFTLEAADKLREHYGVEDLDSVLGNHLLGLGNGIGFFEPLANDRGQQQGLQMGPALWHEFIRPALTRMYAAVREAGKLVMIHSCGDVDELFDDLVAIGLNCFNPFQPEVMDVPALMRQYRGRLSFHGGLSTQRTLPYGSVDEVRAETSELLRLGAAGDYILAPAHAVESDVPLANMLAFIDLAQAQPGYQRP